MRRAAILLGLISGAVQAAPPPPAAPPSYPRLFISPTGEPFRGKGDEDQIARWFRQADSDRDGKLLRAEFAADAERFFTLLDQNGDGEIAGAEIDRYEYELAPEISGLRLEGPGADATPRDRPAGKRPDKKTRRAMARLAALQGASRYGLLDIPEPVTAADVEMNGRVTRQEFLVAANQRFTLLDTARHETLIFAELPKIGGQQPEDKRRR